jgi:drug/metabolite transporter (DMT)-like permease
MTTEIETLAYVAAASVCFTTASLVFTNFSRQISANWMNAFKVTVCLICTLLVSYPMGWISWPQSTVALGLLASGALGLGLGDYFLLEAYVRMGSARTILLFSFQPVFLGFAGWLLFHQSVSLRQFIAILFLMGCLFCFALEKRKSSGHWHLRGLVYALLAVLLDNCGVLLTRWSLTADAGIHPLWANFFRCIGAIFFFAVFNFFMPFGWFKNFIDLSWRRRGLVVLASVFGTMMSLGFYLSALRQGHLAMIGALGGLAPLMSAILEGVYEKRWPSRYFLAAFAMFSIGLGIFLGLDQQLF